MPWDWLPSATDDPLPAAPLYRMAGTYMDYEKLLRVGIPGLLLEVQSTGLASQVPGVNYTSQKFQEELVGGELASPDWRNDSKLVGW